MNNLNKILKTWKWTAYSIVIIGNICLQSEKLYCQNKINVSGNINCANNSVELSYDNSDNNSVYKWKGPDDYYSTAQKPVTSLPGEYTVTVTEPLSGKISTAHTSISIDTASPKGLSVKVSGVLTCLDSVISISGSSVTKDVNFEWTGPEGTKITGKTAAVTKPGMYALKVTNPSNGCTSIQQVEVQQNLTPPENITAIVSAEINCINESVKLIGSSDSQHATYQWKGPGDFISTEKEPVIKKPGLYQLEVIKKENGCKAETMVNVIQNILKPEDIKIYVSDTLSCKTKSVQLMSSSNLSTAIYHWSGPDNFESDKQNIQTNIPGTYSLLIKNPANGCFSRKIAEVYRNMVPPDDFSVNVSGPITCSDSIVFLKASAGSLYLNYSWKGPLDFTSDSPSPQVNVPGEYAVEAKNPQNGCSATKSIIINSNITRPTGLQATVSGEIDCDKKAVLLKGYCKEKKVKYQWTGPEDFSSSKQVAETTLEGEYELSVTNSENGCVTKTKVEVLNNCSN